MKIVSDGFAELSSCEGNSQGLSQASGTYSNVSVNSYEINEAGPSAPKKTRETINIFNDGVVAALDKCRLTDREAVFLVSEIVKSLNFDLESLSMNRTSIRNYRMNIREARAKKIKEVFQVEKLEAAILHWDGKLLYDLPQHKSVERLPVVVTDEIILFD